MKYHFEKGKPVKIKETVKDFGGQWGKVEGTAKQLGHPVVIVKLKNGKTYNFAYDEVQI